MSGSTIFGVGALIAMVPATVLSWRGDRGQRPGPLSWLLLIVAIIGPAGWSVAQLDEPWSTNLSTALWFSIAASLIIFLIVAYLSRAAWQLSVLLLPYLLVLGLIATIWQHAPGRPLSGAAPPAWLDLHILVSVTTYGMLTLAAVCALAVFLQERALKLKQPDRLAAHLPAIAESESLQVRLLATGEVVLGAGLASGAALQYFKSGHFLVADHKTLLSLLAFVVIAALLWAHARTGLRGRRAARLVLLAYLLLTLAYPGVKFVTDVLIAR